MLCYLSRVRNPFSKILVKVEFIYVIWLLDLLGSQQVHWWLHVSQGTIKAINAWPPCWQSIILVLTDLWSFGDQTLSQKLDIPQWISMAADVVLAKLVGKAVTKGCLKGWSCFNWTLIQKYHQCIDDFVATGYTERCQNYNNFRVHPVQKISDDNSNSVKLYVYILCRYAWKDGMYGYTYAYIVSRVEICSVLFHCVIR